MSCDIFRPKGKPLKLYLSKGELNVVRKLYSLLRTMQKTVTLFNLVKFSSRVEVHGVLSDEIFGD